MFVWTFLTKNSAMNSKACIIRLNTYNYSGTPLKLSYKNSSMKVFLHFTMIRALLYKITWNTYWVLYPWSNSTRYSGQATFTFEWAPVPVVESIGARLTKDVGPSIEAIHYFIYDMVKGLMEKNTMLQWLLWNIRIISIWRKRIWKSWGGSGVVLFSKREDYEWVCGVQFESGL